jgi:hypothetical protein
MFTKPAAERLLAVHKRLLAGDPVAPAELAYLTIAPLAEALRISSRGLRDESMAHEAATDAVLDLAKSPQSYTPGRSGVWSFLEMAAGRNLANLLLKERRQRGKISRFADVALHDPARKKVQDSVLTSLAETEATGALGQKLNAKVASMSPADAFVINLMSDGVRATAEYARVLGIADRPKDEQKRAVKRVKDRLLKRLKRSLQENEDG